MHKLKMPAVLAGSSELWFPAGAGYAPVLELQQTFALKNPP